MTLMNPDIHPFFKGVVPRCTLAIGPIQGDCVQGVCKVGEWSEWEFREVEGRYVVGGFRVPPVEVSYEPSCALDILRWSPFILLDTPPLPPYQVLKFLLEDSAVQDLFHFLLFNSIMGHWGRQVTL